MRLNGFFFQNIQQLPSTFRTRMLRHRVLLLWKWMTCADFRCRGQGIRIGATSGDASTVLVARKLCDECRYAIDYYAAQRVRYATRRDTSTRKSMMRNIADALNFVAPQGSDLAPGRPNPSRRVL
jgi:hypothetical protein